MDRPLTIGIFGDLDARHPSRIATDAALAHSAARLSAALDCRWLPTDRIASEGAESVLSPFDALFCAPGSPYASMDGALEGIRFARERSRPFVAT
jgi:CTP synthase (UTP-ammonia lyase)